MQKQYNSKLDNLSQVAIYIIVFLLSKVKEHNILAQKYLDILV